MKISGIFKFSFSMLYRKKAALIIHIFIMAICVCLITYAYMNYYIVNENVITFRDMLKPKPDNLYKISFDNRGVYNEQTANSILDFCRDVVSDKEKNTAIYYYDNYYFFDSKDSVIAYGGDTLCLDEGAFSLKQLYSEDGQKISLSDREMVVGYNYRDIMPQGSTWQTRDGKKYTVKYVLKKNEKWFSSIMLDDEQFSVCLDDYLILPIQYEVVENDPYFGYIFQNGVYFVSDKGEYKTLETYYKDVGKSNNCSITIYSGEKMIHDYISTYRNKYFVTNFKIILVLTLSLIGLLMVNIISLIQQKQTLLIMYRYGVSRREHILIHVVNQILQSVLAACIAYIVMLRRYAIQEYNRLEYYNSIVLASILTVVTVVIIVEIISDKVLIGFLEEVNNGK